MVGKGLSPRCMVKIDLRKSYDSLERNFLDIMMIELGIHLRVVNWVMACVSSVSYSILFNGSPLPPFEAKKGIR